MFLLLSYEYEKLQGNGQHIAAFIATKASLCGEISRLSVDVVESAARKNKKVHKTYWLAFSIHVSDYHNSYFLAGGATDNAIHENGAQFCRGGKCDPVPHFHVSHFQRPPILVQEILILVLILVTKQHW